jgi:hypothetical protein
LNRRIGAGSFLTLGYFSKSARSRSPPRVLMSMSRTSVTTRMDGASLAAAAGAGSLPDAGALGGAVPVEGSSGSVSADLVACEVDAAGVATCGGGA